MPEENKSSTPESKREAPAATPKMVDVKSLERTIFTLTVPCREGCDGKDCLCTSQVFRRPVDDGNGNRGVEEVERRVPGSITFLAGEKTAVPAWLLEREAFKTAVAQGRLRLVKEENKPKAKSGVSGSKP